MMLSDAVWCLQELFIHLWWVMPGTPSHKVGLPHLYSLWECLQVSPTKFRNKSYEYSKSFPDPQQINTNIHNN